MTATNEAKRLLLNLPLPDFQTDAERGEYWAKIDKIAAALTDPNFYGINQVLSDKLRDANEALAEMPVRIRALEAEIALLKGGDRP